MRLYAELLQGRCHCICDYTAHRNDTAFAGAFRAQGIDGRGLLFHHYELDERGRIATAKIVPPTSQNQAAIEADLASFAPSILGETHDVATHRLEMLIRSYDPCISCATHFLDLEILRE